MKNKTCKLNVSILVDEQLAALGAAHIPVSGRRAIYADIHDRCAVVIRKRITREYVGKMVALGLAEPEGCKEDGTSSLPRLRTGERSSQVRIPRPASNPLEAHDSPTGTVTANTNLDQP